MRVHADCCRWSEVKEDEGLGWLGLAALVWTQLSTLLVNWLGQVNA